MKSDDGISVEERCVRKRGEGTVITTTDLVARRTKKGILRKISFK